MLCRLAATVMLAPSGDLQLPNNFVFDRRKFLMGLATATAAPDPALDSMAYSPFSNFLKWGLLSDRTEEEENIQPSFKIVFSLVLVRLIKIWLSLLHFFLIPSARVSLRRIVDKKVPAKFG